MGIKHKNEKSNNFNNIGPGAYNLKSTLSKLSYS